MKNDMLVALLLQLPLLTLPFAYSHAQRAGKLIAIEYPGQLEYGDPLTVTMTVENTGTGTWSNLCAFVGYRSSDNGDTPVTVHTCHSLGDLDPGTTGTFSCSLEGGIYGTAEKIWAGVGAPLG